MTRSTGRRFRRSELAHGGDFPMVANATFEDDAGSVFKARFGSDDAVRSFLGLLLRYPGQTSTVTMFLKPKGYIPAKDAPPEWLPSSLYFDLNREHGIAAAALLVFDAEGTSYQWLSQGDRGRDDVALVMDPFISSRFPTESFISFERLTEAIVQWAMGDEIPPPAVEWRPATEDEVGWPVGAGY